MHWDMPMQYIRVCHNLVALGHANAIGQGVFQHVRQYQVVVIMPQRMCQSVYYSMIVYVTKEPVTACCMHRLLP